MKTQKLIVIAAIICLLVGASAVAMAQEDQEDVVCEEQTIAGEVIYGNVTVTRDNECVIQDSIIFGNVIASDLGRENFLSISRTFVKGKIKVTGGSAQINSVRMPAYEGAPRNRIVINDAATDSSVSTSTIGQGNIVVRRAAVSAGTEIVVIRENLVLNGDIRCRGDASSNTVSVKNLVPRGQVSGCPAF